MSVEYDEYLIQHKANVTKGFEWLVENLPEILLKEPIVDINWQINFNHDTSKTTTEEYEAYDDYFYGKNKSYAVVTAFNYAWLHHIHNNPHHWQHWILMNDDPNEGTICLEMPGPYIVEMICDWWSFSWKMDDLTTIFAWYEEHKDYIKLHDATRKQVERILQRIKEKLEEQKNV